MTLVHLTKKSSNEKTGKIPVSTTSCDTCPDSCPLKGNRKPFKVTHATARQNREAIREANESGFIVNLSADTMEDADRLTALRIGPVVTLLVEGTPRRQTTPGGLPVIACPAQCNDAITCATCGICAIPDHPIVGFYVHGSGKGRAAKVATGEGTGGCYGEEGYHLRMHWNKVSDGERGGEWAEFCEMIKKLPEGQLWRHNQAGDLPGDNLKIDRAKLRKLCRANVNRRGYTYTHKPVFAS